MKTLFAVVAALAIVTPAANAAEVIVNGGFETGVISPWTNDFSPAWSATTADANTGRWSATALGNFQIRQDFAGVATDDITGASFWLRHPTQGNVPAFVSFFYSDLSETNFLVTTVETGWEFFDVVDRIEAGKTLTGFGIFGYEGGSPPFITFLDDVSITTAAIPEPASWALMIAGFGLVGSVLRRQRAFAA